MLKQRSSARVCADMSPFHKTKRGQIILGDSLEYIAGLRAESVDLIDARAGFGVNEVRV